MPQPLFIHMYKLQYILYSSTSHTHTLIYTDKNIDYLTGCVNRSNGLGLFAFWQVLQTGKF